MVPQQLHPQFITDETGRRISVVLPLDEFEALTERLGALETLASGRDGVQPVAENIKSAIAGYSIQSQPALEEHNAWCRRLQALVESQPMTRTTVEDMRREARY